MSAPLATTHDIIATALPLLRCLVLLRSSRVPARLGWFSVSGAMLERAGVELAAVDWMRENAAQSS